LRSLDREGAPQAVVAVGAFRIPKGLKCVERREAGRGAGVHGPQAEFTFRTYCLNLVPYGAYGYLFWLAWPNPFLMSDLPCVRGGEKLVHFGGGLVPFRIEPFPLGKRGSFRTARSSQGRAVVARRSEPLTARTVLKSSYNRERRLANWTAKVDQFFSATDMPCTYSVGQLIYRVDRDDWPTVVRKPLGGLNERNVAAICDYSAFSASIGLIAATRLAGK
jgi:hypothetical protein